jgi:peptide deformylase
VPYVREIIQDGHPTLRKVAKKVDLKQLKDPLFQQLIDDMFETMYHAPGIGLAAPQINVSQRVFVVDLQDEAGKFGPYTLINPRFTLMEGEIESTEGCLSKVGLVGEIKRYERVICVGVDRHGEKIELEGTGLFARCLQHEMHHLDGTLYVDLATNIRPVTAEDEEHDEAEELGDSESSGDAEVVASQPDAAAPASASH